MWRKDEMMVNETDKELIDAKIASLQDWRGDMLARIRKLICEADPAIEESVKWRKAANPTGVPVWERAGILCTGETYRDKVKITFARGASLEDPTGLFNASLEGGTRRAIDLFEHSLFDEAAFTHLVRRAVDSNLSTFKANSRRK